MRNRVKRITKIAIEIARLAGCDDRKILHVAIAAWVCKVDLSTLTVREFPELQGVIGRLLWQEVWAEQFGENMGNI